MVPPRKNKSIGHNKPPRKIGWKSISVNKYVYEMLQQVAEKKRSLINCFKSSPPGLP